MRARTTLLMALLVLAACKEQPGQEILPDPVKPESKDASIARGAQDAGVSGRKVAELAGTWRGELDHERYGKVRGDVVIDADGNVSYTVTGEGVTHSGVFRVLEWTGETLRVKDQSPAAGEYTVSARLSGPRLELEVQPVGKVVLVRAGSKPLAP